MKLRNLKTIYSFEINNTLVNRILLMKNKSKTNEKLEQDGTVLLEISVLSGSEEDGAFLMPALQFVPCSVWFALLFMKHLVSCTQTCNRQKRSI